MMSKMARNRSALHDVLAQGASNRDTTVCVMPYDTTRTEDINLYHAEFILRNIICIYSLLFLSTDMSCLHCIVITMVADALATQVARASAAMILTL